ncbi:hypothetical protein INT43_006123 [Umbelopsis isabellina]|uniref:Uncharacterized protein n=1 Tax=Mortierella isabellina TaxID=91625 RepID=A0A8H7UKH5_MORIS|nr:hypothetical protein INT43_006123 [Umbelopsis isabellina]
MSPITRKLEGKVAIVTGGSRGIGEGIVKNLAEAGAYVVVNYTSSNTQADALVAEIISNGGKAITVQADMGTIEGPQKIVDAAVDTFGKIDIIVNNAGVAGGIPLGSITAENYEKIYNVNVRGPLFLVQAAAPHLQEYGRIINITSVAARTVSPNITVYGSSKAALESMSRYWASEFAEKNITSNCINPGPVSTDMMNNYIATMAKEQSDAFLQDILSRALFKRVAQPVDIATVTTFLASSDSQWITGDVLGANGGMVFV